MTIASSNLQIYGANLRSGVEAVGGWLDSQKLTRPSEYAYLQAAANSLLLALEQDAGVPPGTFGSTGIASPSQS